MKLQILDTPLEGALIDLDETILWEGKPQFRFGQIDPFSIELIDNVHEVGKYIQLGIIEQL